MSKNAVVLVCNKLYFQKLKVTLNQLKNIGKWKGDVVLIHGDDILPEDIINLKENRLITDSFLVPEFDTSQIINNRRLHNISGSDGRIFTKCFQYHKIYVFSKFMKKWEKILYIDTGMVILDDINIFFTLDTSNSILAHSDAYPTYNWKLYTQFDVKSVPVLTQELSKYCDLNSDYFQTTMLYFDSSIITDNTCDELIKLSYYFFNSITNEQGIMNVYFNGIHKLWKQIPIKCDNKLLYDFCKRDNTQIEDYTMIKYIY